MKTLFFHLGYPKTATTYLQQVIFPNLCSTTYVPVLTQHAFEDRVLKAVFGSPSDEEMRTIGRLVLPHRPRRQSLVSAEVFSVGSISERFLSRDERCKVLRRIQIGFEGWRIKIILGVREQSDIIRSFYLQHLHQGGTLDIHEFLQRYEVSATAFGSGPFFDSFNFSGYIEQLYQAYGAQNVYVYFFENLRQDRQRFINSLLAFLGEYTFPALETIRYNKGYAHNIGYGPTQIALARFFNNFFRLDQNPRGQLPVIRVPGVGNITPNRFLRSSYLSWLFRSRYELPKDLRHRIRDFYREENRRLRKRFGLPLPPNYA